MFKKSLFLAGILLLGTFSAAFAVSLRLAHPDVDVVMAPGDVRSDALTIENPSDETLTVRIYAEDWSYTNTGFGDKNFFPAGTLPKSASKWLVLNPLELELPPFSRRDVKYTLTVPKDPSMSGTYHSVIFYESNAGEMPGPSGAMVVVAARLGTVVRVGMKGTLQRSGKIEDVRITLSSGNQPTLFELTFHNTGNTDIILKGNFIIMDGQGMPKARGKLGDLITESGQTVTRKSEWAGRLASGEYDVIFTFDLGEGQLLTEERKITAAAAL